MSKFGGKGGVALTTVALLLGSALAQAAPIDASAFCDNVTSLNPPPLGAKERAEFSIGFDGSTARRKGNGVVRHTVMLDATIRGVLAGQSVGVRIDRLWSANPASKDPAPPVCGVMSVDAVLPIPPVFDPSDPSAPDVPRLSLFLTPEQGTLLNTIPAPLKNDTWPKAATIAQDSEQAHIYWEAATLLSHKLATLNATIVTNLQNAGAFSKDAVRGTAAFIAGHLDRPFDFIPLEVLTQSGVMGPEDLTISGVGEPGWRVRLTDTTTDLVVGSPLVDATGHWTTQPYLPAGSYILKVELLDGVGAVIDDAPPTTYVTLEEARQPGVNIAHPRNPITAGLWDEAAKQVGDEYATAAPGLTSLLKDVRALRTAALVLFQQPDVFSATAYLAAWAPFAGLKKPAAPGDSYCKAAFQTAVYEKPESAPVWSFGTFELPWTAADDTVELPILAGAVPQRQVGQGPITAWVTSTQPEQGLSFYWDEGSSTAPDVAKEIAAFVSVAAKAAANHTQFLQKVLGGGLSEKDTAEDTLQEIFRDTLSTESACLSQLGTDRVELPLMPLAQVESRARTSRAVSETGKLTLDRNYTIYACKGPCIVSGTGANVVAKTQAQTPFGWRVSLVGALTYNFQIASDSSFYSYSWRRTTAYGATQQIFEFDQIIQPLVAITPSLLLSFFGPEFRGNQLGVGFGPGITNLAGTAAFPLWTAQVLWRPGFLKSLADKLYFTAGIGVVATTEPLADVVGTRVALSPTNGTATPPVPQFRTVWNGDWNLGIGLDLSAFGDAASAVFGVKAPAPTTAAPGGGG